MINCALEEMGDDAILSPAQEEAGLKAREISKQESAVVDKSQQLVNDLWLTFSFLVSVKDGIMENKHTVALKGWRLPQPHEAHCDDNFHVVCCFSKGVV